MSTRTLQALKTAVCYCIDTELLQNISGCDDSSLLLYWYRTAIESIECFCTSSLVEWYASEDAGGRKLCRYLKMTLLLPHYSILCVLITVFCTSIRCLYVSCLSANLSVRGVKLMFENTIGHSTYIYPSQ